MSYKAFANLLFLALWSGFAVAQPLYPALAQNQDAGLQQGLDTLLENRHLQPFALRQTLALVIADITDPENIRYAQVNANHMMYAASLPKLAILVAACVKVERRQLELDDTLWQDMNRMIRNSDNQAANRVLERVGKESLLDILQEPKFHFYNKGGNGGLWVGKSYSEAAAYHRDPLMNLSHGATALQAARVYYLLATGQLLGPKMSSKMLEVLSAPAIEHKLVKGLKQSYSTAKIYRKSGTWRTFHADSALIEHEGGRYIIVILVDHPDGGDWISSLAPALMDLLTRPSPTRQE